VDVRSIDLEEGGAVSARDFGMERMARSGLSFGESPAANDENLGDHASSVLLLNAKTSPQRRALPGIFTGV
jgi:hypothetical protein